MRADFILGVTWIMPYEFHMNPWQAPEPEGPAFLEALCI